MQVGVQPVVAVPGTLDLNVEVSFPVVVVLVKKK